MDLEKSYDQINQAHFEGLLPQPLLRWNSRLKSSAELFIPGARVSRLGWRLDRPPVIEIASYLLELPHPLAEVHVKDTLGHEMIHYWLYLRRQPFGHTSEFRRKMNEMGVSRYNRVPQLRSRIHVYGCSTCGSEIRSQRRMKNVACKKCCIRYANGRYDSQYEVTWIRTDQPGIQGLLKMTGSPVPSQEKIDDDSHPSKKT